MTKKADGNDLKERHPEKRFGRSRGSSPKSINAFDQAGDSIRKVLVVDDEDSVRDVLSEIISSMGLDVVVARNGKEGLSLFREHPFDMVLTDLRMPLMDGLSMSMHIKEQSPHTPIILVTGEEREHFFRKTQFSQVDSVLFKPFGLEDIEKTVEKMLDGNKAE